MKISTRITDISTTHYKKVTFGLVGVMLLIAFVAAIPSLLPSVFTFLTEPGSGGHRPGKHAQCG